nr:MAK10-like protein [Tanacetum cinerariifolium]
MFRKSYSSTTLGDANPICTLGDYSRPSHEGYRNTFELPEGNNVVPLQSDTIQLVQNGCSFYGLRSEDPNQHLKDFLKLVDSLDLDDPSRHGRILLLVSLLNYFYREGLQNSVTASLCSNNIKESLFLKHGLVSRTYSKKSLIMASTFGSKSKSIMTMSIPPQDEPLINRLVAVSEKLDDTPTRNTTINPTAQMNFTSTNYPTKEELRGKGIKSPSKLLSLKYLSQSSLAEQNGNPSSLEQVEFVISIIILNTEDEAKESVNSSATEHKDHEMIVESEEEFEEETKE